jgi:deoxyribodipyrimidine photo-lyase
MTTIVWFRQDLRLADNPALLAAAGAGPVIPVYLHTPEEEGAWPLGGASRWWLHQSLQRLDENLSALSSRLYLRVGRDSLSLLLELARTCGAGAVVWNRRYEPQAIGRDRAIKQALRDAGLTVTSHNASLLHEPWEISSQTGGPMQVFTPYWRRCLALGDPPEPLPAPSTLTPPRLLPAQTALEELDLLPRIDWTRGLETAWQPGRAGALRQLETFLENSFAGYSEQRNRPDLGGTSRLSPHLHFGEIGPREVWQATRLHGLSHRQAESWRQSQFVTELGWREFAYHLLYHFPQTPEQPLRAKYASFPWKSDAEGLRAWQRGRTGYPIVDAGLRELWTTGWMHNRVRMITASFLVKDLLLPWNEGARWFWDTLVDADLASNTLGWQWAAGCGADAAPYFRIFNPVFQGSKFDPDGAYVRRWVPELARLPTKWLHEPWNAPPATLQTAGVQLGATYPRPYVDHDAARREALAALATLGGSAS